MLLLVELSVAFEVPLAPAVAYSDVPAVLVVLAVVLAFVPAAVSVSEAVFPLVAFNAELAVELLVAAFVLASLLEDDAELLLDALLLELSLAANFSLDDLLSTSLLALAELLVSTELLLAL